MLRPRSFRQGFLAMPRFFDVQDDRDLHAIIRFEMGGPEPGLWWMEIRDGALQVGEGAAPGPASLTIKTRSDTWLRIMRGELTGAEAFATARAVGEGDTDLLLRLPSFFQLRVDKSDG